MRNSSTGSPGSRTTGDAQGAWTVLWLAAITSTLTGPGQTIGVAVFIDHFVDDLHLSRAQISGAYLVGTLIGATLLPAVGRFIDRRGVRRVQVLIGLLFSLALVNMSFVNGLVWLTLGFTGIRLLGQGSLSLVATVTVSLSFVRNRGTAIGIFSTVSSSLMALVPVALAVVISQVGWRSAWLVSAVVVAMTVAPIAWFGLRGLPTGTSTAPPTTADEPRPATNGSFDRAQAMRTRAFWLLVAISSTASMLGTALNFHQIDLLGETGISKTAAAALFIPQVIGATIAGLSVGYIGDRIGTRYLPAAGMVLLISAHWLAAIVGPGAVAFIYAVVLGAAGGATRTITATLVPAWFGTDHLGSIQGSLTLFGVGASALGPVALALTESAFGSYPPALLALSTLPVAVLLFALGPQQKLRPANM